MRTLNQLFQDSVAKYADNVMMYEKSGHDYKPATYRQIQQDVHDFAAGLMQLGFQKGDRAALLSEGRNAWVVSELGILHTGGVNVPLSPKLSEPSEIKFRINHSESRFLIISKNQYPKVQSIKGDMPKLEKIIVIDGNGETDGNIFTYVGILELGKKYLLENNSKFEETWKSVNGDDHANICYTSGTTADPKGIILTHRNYTANVEQAESVFKVPEYYTSLLILPWDHAFAHTAGIYTLMNNGASMASIKIGSSPMETLKNIPLNIKENKPHLLLSVPSLAKNFRKNIEKGIRDKGAFFEKLFNHSLKVAYIYNGNGFDRGKGLRFLLKPYIALYDVILFKKIREGFGGRIKFFVGGGALLDIELQRFFFAIGMPMYQGYGLTEAAPIISANGEHKHKMGSSGIIVSNLDVKICDDDGNEVPTGEKGEIVVRGENVMKGYWKNEEATSETIKDGWLHSGDLGYMDKDGFLYVLGRFKSLLIADDGEKYSPEGMEEAFVENSKFIDHCMLYNNQNPYTVALINPNFEGLKRELKNHNISLDSENGIHKMLQIIESELAHYRKGGKFDQLFPQRWLPVAIGIIPEGFTEENQMMNSTLKMVRGVITETYSDLVEFLYTPEAKNILNPRNIKVVNSLMGNI